MALTVRVSVRVGNSVRVRYSVRVRVSGLPVLGNGLSELFFVNHLAARFGGIFPEDYHLSACSIVVDC